MKLVAGVCIFLWVPTFKHWPSDCVQIGSYYGSEIAAVDFDGDGVTDNLLVSAPMFFSGGWEKGKVYIYRITEQVNTQPCFDAVYTCMPVEDCRVAAYFSCLHN